MENADNTPSDRASLAPAGEPFGYWHEGDTMDESDFFLAAEFGNVGCKHCVPLYAVPPSDAGHRVGLTEAEIVRIFKRYGGDMLNCTRAIERHHGIRATISESEGSSNGNRL